MAEPSIAVGKSYGTFYTLSSEMDNLAKRDGNRIGTLPGGRGHAVYDKNNTLLSCMLVCDSNNDGVYDSFTYSSNGLTHEGGLNGERKVKEISTNRYKAVDINDNGIVDDGEIKGL